ncbi:non-canonical purine NTP diphosphatase [Barnesiella propionica]|uniref:non-canonical purine NTP diphosphatase n=1 Tax=Barnesiella propionica TaxID=2981781 RepID=UPI0011C72FD7|nr:non-canonical purine NTP diphosphatase [Barnesiella propionica]MCU6768883.1 non-canonical purine NTP diphosphatase [Barnesiella propionica]
MEKIVFATNNLHKLEEVRNIVGERMQILSLSDIGCTDDIPETADTIEGNALIKARYIKNKYGYDCFSDDTGLEIKALNNEPGVYSARYAGENGNASKNIEKVLSKLKGIKNRKAHFRTCIALITGKEVHLFEGKIEGEIMEERKGFSGFGYDSIFKPVGSDLSFAEMGEEEKNKISHRAIAVQKLAIHLMNI